MLATPLPAAQGGPRLDGNAVTVMVGIVAIGAVALVFRASRPSVMGRYPAAPRPDDEESPAHTAEPETRA